MENCQHFLDTGTDLQAPHRPAPDLATWRGILLADLNKAFERVDIGWVLRILVALGVPLWLFNYVAFLSTARYSQFRIGNIMGGMLKMKRALDMGQQHVPEDILPVPGSPVQTNAQRGMPGTLVERVC